MADNITIARPYAQAAFELAHEAGQLADWGSALETAGQIMADGEVAEYLSQPTLTDARRFEFLTGLFGAAGAGVLAGDDKRGSNFLKLLIENDRVGALPEIATRFEALKAEIENTVDVTVATATPLSADQQQKIAAALKARLGREINLATEIDENLIGGAVIRAGDVVIDGSLRARLSGLANALIN